MKITNEIRNMIFASYLGCNVQINTFKSVDILTKTKIRGINGDRILTDEIAVMAHDCSILVKSLDNITKEDAIEMANMHGFDYGMSDENKALYVKSYFTNHNVIHRNMADYLRLKGYATPYGDISIKKLIRAKIYIIEK